MVFGSIVTSPRSSLSPRQTLDLAKAYLEVAYHAIDPDVALVLCHDTEISLHQAKKAVKRAEDQNVIKDIAVTYIDLGNLLEKRDHAKEAKVSYKKAEKLGYVGKSFSLLIDRQDRMEERTSSNLCYTSIV